MFTILSVLCKAPFWPLWVLWRGYLLLWWAFDGAEEGATQGEVAASHAGVGAGEVLTGPSQNTAFEVADTRPTPAGSRPEWLLRAGYAASLAASAGAGVLAGGAASHHAVEPGTAVAAWLWASAMMAVGSIFAVKGVVARRQGRAWSGVLHPWRGWGRRPAARPVTGAVS
jgi:hypothetical protein